MKLSSGFVVFLLWICCESTRINRGWLRTQPRESNITLVTRAVNSETKEPAASCSCPWVDHVSAKALDTTAKRKFRVVWVVVSENMHGHLQATLACNKHLADRVVVVTSDSDSETKSVCKSYGVDCHVTDALHLNGDPFNKGRALAEVQHEIHNDPKEKGSTIILGDTDTCWPQDIWQKIPNPPGPGQLITSVDRCFFRDPQQIRNGLPSGQEHAPMPTMGFFQMYLASPTAPLYSTKFTSAASSDLQYANVFFKVTKIPLYVYHIGATGHWGGYKGNTSTWADVTFPARVQCPCCTPQTQWR